METEIKFQVPPARRAALARAVATTTARTTRLQAIYFDTATRALAQAGLALRLRKEGRIWVQTLKGRDGIVSRLEHEVPLPRQVGEPQLDPARHAGTRVGELLAQALGGGAELLPVYRIDVQRLHRIVRQGAARIELAYDRGELRAGARVQAIDEIEFELKAGPTEAMAQLARRWVARFALWWDVRPKAEQGLRLADGRGTVPAVKAGRASWPRGATPHQVWQTALMSALAQALPNAAELAGDRGAAEHVHQLRVALRRLRAALRLLAGFGPDAAAAHALEADWREPFGVLGAARDADVLGQTYAPRLAAAGAPPFSWPALQPGQAPGDCVRGAAFNDLLLRTLALALQPAPAASAAAESGDAPDLHAAASAVLRSAWRQVRRDAAAYAGADTAARHRTRKRLKRLRYTVEFLQPLLAPKATRRLLRSVAKALVALGDFNDLEQAHRVCLEHAQREPTAWFAVGWLAAQREGALARASAALAALADAPRPWRSKD